MQADQEPEPGLEQVGEENDTAAPKTHAYGDLVGLARTDLGQRLTVAPDRIALSRLQEVTWRDGSLGCPQPGRMYTQMLVDGILMELRVAGTTYRYHSGDGDPFYCAQPAGAAPLPRQR